MRRLPVLVALLAVVLLGAVAVAGLPAVRAQDATPTDEEAFFAGITFEALGFGRAAELPAAPADVSLLRFTFEPDAGFPIEASDPSGALVVVESGELTVIASVPITVTRAATIAAFATPGADEASVPAPEEMAANTEFTMAAGDSAYFTGGIDGQVTNAGPGPAAILVTSIEPVEPELAASPTS